MQACAARMSKTAITLKPRWKPKPTLFVGKPILSETAAGKWTVELSRRIVRADGRFDGVVTASLDLGYLTRIYNSVNIGQEGYIRVIGLDGIVRATSGNTMYVLGKDFSRADLFTNLGSARGGWYYTGVV